jgi:ABC-type sugar transport system substrate-binding protein
LAEKIKKQQFNLALKIDDKNSVSLESDPILEGRLMGDYAAKKLPQGAKVAILEGEPGNLAAASREQGILEGLKARPDIKVIADLTSHWPPRQCDGDHGRLAAGLSAD